MIADMEAGNTASIRLHEGFGFRHVGTRGCGGAQCENATLDRFLDALAAWINDAPGWYGNCHQEMPEHGDWTFFARALSAAVVHE